MGESPESLVREFYAAWANPEQQALRSFFHADAVWVDGPQGVRHGADEVASELANQLKAVGGVRVDITLLVAEGPTVMVEQTSNASIRGNPISTVIMAVFELDADGRIKQWREAYDLKSMMDQIKAASATP